MTPQLQQAIRLLQLSTLELQTEIQQFLENNPMLEELDGNETNPIDHSEQIMSSEIEPLKTTDSGNESELNLKDNAIPDELPVDSGWDDLYDISTGGSGAPDMEDKDYESQVSSNESLRDLLLRQAQLDYFSPTDMAIATALVDAINDDGYLTCSLEDIQASVEEKVELDEILAVLHQVQNFDPPGIGARDLCECLLLQLRALPQSTPFVAEATTLVRENLQLLARHDFPQIARRMKITEEELRPIVQLVQSLNPRPGAQLATSTAQYLVPDVIVTRVSRGVWRVELNPDLTPRLRVNPYYASLVRRADNSPDNTYLRGHLQEARWFLKSLQSRNETLLRVSRAIVDCQRDFLEHGEEAMRPLVLHDIAEELGMHEATISRVTTQKYMYTPRGIFELKYFFSSHLNTVTGNECSSIAVRALIRRMVNAEKPAQPLSDKKISDLLGELGIQVARRTVAKYREAMAIPPSCERKRLV